MPDESGFSIKGLMVGVFVVLLTSMLLLAGVLVTLQAVGFLLGNGPWISLVANKLDPMLFTLSGVFGIWTLLVAYVAGWKAAD